jgi:membrane protein implicated in regulation of membrane protease activity
MHLVFPVVFGLFCATISVLVIVRLALGGHWLAAGITTAAVGGIVVAMWRRNREVRDERLRTAVAGALSESDDDRDGDRASCAEEVDAPDWD